MRVDPIPKMVPSDHIQSADFRRLIVGVALHRGWRSIKKLPRCRTIEMADSCSDKSGGLEVHRVHRNRRVAAFLPIRIVGDAPTFLAAIVGANLPVP